MDGDRNATLTAIRVSRAGQLAYLARYDEAEADCRAAAEDSRPVWPHAAEAETLAWSAIREAESSALRSDILVSLRLGLAERLNGQERYAEAERMLEGLHPQDSLSPVHYLTLAAGTLLGSALAGQGELDEAERQLRINAAAWAEHFGDEHPGTAAAQAELARITPATG